MPKLPTLPSGGTGFGVGIQGSGTTTSGKITTQPMTPFMPPTEKRWVDVFLRAKGRLQYTIKTNATFANVTNAAGTLTDTGLSQLRSVVTINWAAAPAGQSAVELTITSGSTNTAVIIPLNNTPPPPANFEGHIESNGVVSIEAAHFVSIRHPPNTNTNTNATTYATLPSYGRTHSGVKLWPVTTPPQPSTPNTSSSPALIYRMHTSTRPTKAIRATIYLSASENADIALPNRYTLRLNNGSTTTVQPTPLAADAGAEPAGWGTAVTRNAWIAETDLGGAGLAPGVHELEVRLLNPTMVLTKVVLDFGGVRASELGPPESARVCAGGAGECRLDK